MASSIESVASFSVILAETFAAIGLATVAPNAVIAIAKIAKDGTTAVINAAEAKITGTKDKFPDGSELISKGLEVIKACAGNVRDLNLLMPDSATIHSEFTFQASDEYKINAGGGGTVQAVNVTAGFSAMYSSSSSNTITMDINFAPVAVTF